MVGGRTMLGKRNEPRLPQTMRASADQPSVTRCIRAPC
jgi:hypothetical protein